MHHSFTLTDFMRESLRIEGIHRDPTPQETDATKAFLALPAITVEDMVALVNVYAPGHRLRDQPGLNVRVGGYIAPPGGPQIRPDLADLLHRVSARQISSFEAHVLYEKQHPFTDGNGRSGRALWLWMRRSAPLGFLHHFYYEALAAS